MSKFLCILITWMALAFHARAAALRFSVINLNELFGLHADEQHAPIISNMNERGEFLHSTSYIPPEGGTARATEAFVEHTDGTRTRFAVPYANGIFAEVRLNNRGEVAAIVIPDPANFTPAAIEVWTYSAQGAPHKVEGVPGTGGAENLGFNDHGQISVSNADENRAWRYTPGTGWENLGSLASDGYAVPAWGNAINNAGAVVGRTAIADSTTITPFLYRDGTGMESIPAAIGTGRAISDNFILTGDGGWVYFADEMRMSYIYNNQAFGFIRPTDVNLLGVVVGGTVFSSPGLENAGFAWSEETGRILLSDVIDDQGWKINNALALNEDGWILAIGHYGNDPVHDPYAYLLLRPVPEPGSAAFVVFFGAIIFAHRQRKGRSITLAVNNLPV